MSTFGQHVQKADWKKEKHVPVIEVKSTPQKNEAFDVHLCVGNEIAHPNTTEHHISWIKLFFKPANDKFTYHLGTYQFDAHFESVKGANEGPAACEPCVHTKVILKEAGQLIALSYCNIHGLWESELEINF